MCYRIYRGTSWRAGRSGGLIEALGRRNCTFVRGEMAAVSVAVHLPNESIYMCPSREEGVCMGTHDVRSKAVVVSKHPVI